MTNFSQNNSPQINHTSSYKIHKHIEMGEVTTGSSEGVIVFSLWGKDNPVKEAKSIIPKIKNAAVVEQIEKLLLIIQNFVRILQDTRGSVISIPPLHAYIAEKDSVVLEWIFPNFRVGFNIEPNQEESGWHLISNKKLDDATESGPLEKMEEKIQTLFEFILKNI